jgi:5-formyltetrahydrofolate cyclo-ligase
VGTSEDKRRLRAVLRARRAAIAPATRAAASAAIASAILADPRWRAARSVAAFVGTPEEPDTRPLLQHALAQGKTLWLPRVIEPAAGISELVRTDDLQALVPAPFGLFEPARTEHDVVSRSIAPELRIDLVLVPGLAFSRHGARIGHGPGHYDRLLAPVRDLATPLRIGVAFAAMIDPPEGEILMEPHDVPMHALFSEDGISLVRHA